MEYSWSGIKRKGKVDRSIIFARLVNYLTNKKAIKKDGIAILFYWDFLLLFD